MSETTLAANEHLSAYNRAAIEHAARLHELRQQRIASDADDDDQVEPDLDRLLPARDKTALGVFREYQRMGERPVSAELQQRADDAGIRFEHLGLTIGSVLHDFDLRATSDPALTALVRDCLLERKVVFFRDQHLTEDEQVAFGRRFGELDAFPFGKPGHNPFILEIVHGAHSPGTENGWHTDVTWMENPSLGSIAQCVECPPVGGDTLFSDSHAAYLGLPAQLRERIEFLHGVNDYRIFLAGRGEKALPDEVVDAIKADLPFGVHHPVVRTHPETRKQALYIHGGFLRHDSLYDSRTGDPVGADESRAIVRQLLAQHARPEYTCRFSWSDGSIAFWDNRAAQHYASSDYYPHRRLLRRVTVSGDRPFHDPST